MGKLVAGVGMNDAEYPVVKFETVGGKRKRVWVCPYYQVWMNMLNRIYSGHPSNEAYKRNISVCKQWLTFSIFKRWMESQDWADKQLDKDLKLGREYSPANCVFVSEEVNMFCRAFDKQSNTGIAGIIKYNTGYTARTTVQGKVHKAFVKTLEEAKKYLQVLRLGWVETIPDPEDVKELVRDYILQKYT